MRRRDFLVGSAILVGAARAAAQPSPAHARIGWLAQGDTMPRHFFDEALARLGWIEGKNVSIERRFADSAGEQVGEISTALVAAHPDVIVAMGASDAKPLVALTRTIPIVVVAAADPVAGSRREPRPAGRERHWHCGPHYRSPT